MSAVPHPSRAGGVGTVGAAPPGAAGPGRGCRGRQKGHRAAVRATAVPRRAGAAGAPVPGGRSPRQQEKLPLPEKVGRGGGAGGGRAVWPRTPGRGRGGVCRLEGRGPASERPGLEGVNEQGCRNVGTKQGWGYPVASTLGRRTPLRTSGFSGVRPQRDEWGRCRQ